MSVLTVNFNNQTYIARYNEQTGYYELELTAPETGGAFQADISFMDYAGETTSDYQLIQVLARQQLKIQTNKTFMWIFSYKDFSVKKCLEIQDYEINIDEETNANSIIKVLKKTEAVARDIIAIKKDNEIIYWGEIQNVSNEDGLNSYEYTIKYLTNMFDRNIKLEDEDIIRTTGIEDFIANAITKNFISNSDTFINVKYLKLRVLTHTPKQTSVTNVEDNIYNLHTWMTNCTQSYDIIYSFEIVDKMLILTIENKSYEKELIDVIAQPISNYQEVFETDIVSKVTVLYDKVNEQEQKGEYTLYLLNDRTTTTDATDKNRADGKIETIYTENYEDAPQAALDKMKANSYNHNITFSYHDRYIKIGTPIAIKTKESLIYDTYISAIKITRSKFYEYTCGNIRVKFIDKLLKERKS